MSDSQPTKPGRFVDRLTTGNIITIVTLGGLALMAFTTTQANMSALADRVKKGEDRDDETARTLGTVRESIIELKGDQRAIRNENERQGKQLDRIELQIQTLIKNGNAPPRPAP